MLWYGEEYGKSSEQYQKAFTAYELLTTMSRLVKLSDEEAAAMKIEKSRV